MTTATAPSNGVHPHGFSRKHAAKLRSQREQLSLIGPPPTNPLREVRLQESLGLQEMADLIGISKQALIRLEQGTYDTILPVVLEYYRDNFHLSELALMDGYESFQEKQRARHFHYFGPTLVPEALNIREHPLRILRRLINVTPTEVAKDLCLPHATLTYFERKAKQQKSVPKSLINVLHEIGYSTSQINEFHRAYDKYREYVCK